MSPFNRHNNLNPINGFIREIKYHPGKFLVAFNPKSSTDNERCSFLYETDQKDLLVMRQIAGAVARRIVNYLKPDERVRAGEEMGFIKFGSRVDLFIPMDYEINIKLGDKVVAGQTLLAKKKER
jgi:phosphatidylserine decarboxylase